MLTKKANHEETEWRGQEIVNMHEWVLFDLFEVPATGEKMVKWPSLAIDAWTGTVKLAWRCRVAMIHRAGRYWLHSDFAAVSVAAASPLAAPSPAPLRRSTWRQMYLK